MIGIEEGNAKSISRINPGPTIFCGALQLPKGKKCLIFDITGRKVELDRMSPGVYFIEIDGKIVQKVIKVR